MKYFPIIILVIFVLVSFLSLYYSEAFVFHNARLKDKIEGYGIFAPLSYIAFFLVATMMFLPSAALYLLSGVLFGTFWGTVISFLGAYLTSIVFFYIYRLLGRDFIERIARKWFKRLYEYNLKFGREGLWTVIFVRIIPVIPFYAENVSLALSQVNRRDYFLGTLIGLFPVVIIYVHFGNSVATADRGNIIISLILMSLLFLFYPVYRKIKNGKIMNSGLDN